MAEQVEKPAAAPLALPSSVADKQAKEEDSAAALEQATTPRSSNKTYSSAVLTKMKQQSNNKVVEDDGHRWSSLAARVDQKVRVLLMSLLLPPLIPVSKVCRLALSSSFHMLTWSTINVRPTLEYKYMQRRLLRLPPSQAAVARVLPAAMLWCGAAGMAAAALALLLGLGGRRSGRLALAYVAVAAVAANHCLSARVLSLVLLDDINNAGMVSWALFAAGICIAVFFAARDLADLRSLRKAAAAEHDDDVAQPAATNN